MGCWSEFNPAKKSPTPALPEIGEGEERDAPSDAVTLIPRRCRRRHRNRRRRRRAVIRGIIGGIVGPVVVLEVLLGVLLCVLPGEAIIVAAAADVADAGVAGKGTPSPPPHGDGADPSPPPNA